MKKSKSVNGTIRYSDFDPDQTKHQELAQRLNSNQDLRVLMSENLAQFNVTQTHVQFTCPQQNVLQVEAMIRTFVVQLLEDA